MTTMLKSRPVAFAMAAIVAAAAAVLIALGGNSSGGAAFGTELAEAAGNTAGVSSGVAKSIIAVGGRTTETVMRFDGDDIDVAAGDVVARVVDGRVFRQEADGTWTEAGDAETTADDVTKADITSTAIVDAVRNAEGAVQEGNVFRARVTDAALAGIDNALLGLGGDAQLAEGAIVEVELAGDLIRRVSVASGDVVRSVTYTELNEPQEITVPETE